MEDIAQMIIRKEKKRLEMERYVSEQKVLYHSIYLNRIAIFQYIFNLIYCTIYYTSFLIYYII